MTYPRQPLRNLLELSIGGIWGKPPGESEVDVRVVRVTELKQGGRLDLSTAAARSVTKRELEVRRLRPGDLLLEKSGGGPKTPVGRVGLVRDGSELRVCANFMQLMRPDPRLVDPRYLHLYLHHLHSIGGTAPLQTATTNIRNIKASEYVQLDVPMPTLAEQRRIVEILEDHLSRLDAADRDLSDCHRRQDAWTKGTLQHLIWGASQPVTEVSRVLREPMRNGRSDRASNEPNAVRTLTLTAVTKRDFSDTNTKLTSTSREIARGLWLQRGDILVQRSNTPELVGTSARYDGPDDWAIFPDLLIRLRSDESVMDSRFLAAALRSERAHRSLRAKAKGLAGSMPKIDQGALGATLVPLPPLIDQQTVCMQIDEVMAASTRLRDAIVAAQRRGGALRRGVLAAAFEGKLTGRHTDAEVIEESAAAEPEEGRM